MAAKFNLLVYAKVMPIFVAIIWTLLIASPVWATDSPEQTLRAVNEALEKGDTDAFTRLVNVDGIINDGINVFVNEARNPDSARTLPPMLALMLSNVVSQENIRHLLLQESRAFVLNGVATGTFAGKQLNGGQMQGMFAPLFANASMARKEIRNPGKPMRQEDGSYIMTFTIYDHGNEHDYPVVVRLVQLPDGKEWQIARVENLPQIIGQIRREAAKE